MEILNQLEQIDKSEEDNGDENIALVLEETEMADCKVDLGTISEDVNIQYQLCEINRNDTVAYQVTQINENRLNETDISINNPSSATVQILTSSINGQYYILSEGTEVFTADPLEITTPCVTKLRISSTNNPIGGLKKRDEKRRVTHNEVERRRRDKINNWISKLGKLLPDIVMTSKGERKINYELQSKSEILSRACNYINDLKKTKGNLMTNLDENTKLLEEMKSLRHLINQLKKENAEMKKQISKESLQYNLNS